MKISRCLYTTGVLGVTLLSSQAQVLLQVDVSNPAAVTFTSTGANSAINDSTSTTFDGVMLMGFFTSSVAGSSRSVAGSLLAAGATGIYDTADINVYSTNPTELNLYNGGVETQAFTTGGAAFSGSGTIDLIAVVGSLPLPGALGNVIVGDSSGGSGATIGQWQVVPEPHEYALLAGLGLLGFAAWRRRRA